MCWGSVDFLFGCLTSWLSWSRWNGSKRIRRAERTKHPCHTCPQILLNKAMFVTKLDQLFLLFFIIHSQIYQHETHTHTHKWHHLFLSLVRTLLLVVIYFVINSAAAQLVQSTKLDSHVVFHSKWSMPIQPMHELWWYFGWQKIKSRNANRERKM